MQRVYQEMERDGLISSKRGTGYFFTEEAEVIEKTRRELAEDSLCRFVIAVLGRAQSRSHIRRAYCRAQCIGGMVGPWRLPQAQDNFYHFLHLFFVGRGCACNTLLDRVGPELQYRQAPFSKGRKNHPARFGHRDRAGNIFPKKQYFHGRFFWPIIFQNFPKALKDKKKAFRMGAARLGFYASVIHVANFPGAAVNHSPACGSKPRINADDAHNFNETI
jgi:hypothetical protein